MKNYMWSDIYTTGRPEIKGVFQTFNHNSWTFSNFIFPQVIFHTHTDYATALGCLRTSEFPMIHQNGIQFFGRVAFHEEYGLPSDKDESELLGTYFTGEKNRCLVHVSVIMVSEI